MKNALLIFLVSFLVSLLLYLLMHGFIYIYTSLLLTVFSSLLLIFYASRRAYFYLVFTAVILLVIFNTMAISFSVEIISISLAVQSILIRSLSRRTKPLDRKIELRRDSIHIIFGAVLLFIVYLKFIQLSAIIILLGFLFAYMAPEMEREIKNVHILFEREGVIFGSGAVFMGAGALILIGFVHNVHFLFLGLFALMISDPIATFVGLSRLKEPGKKSIIGSSAFFLSLLVPSVIIFGVLGIIFSAIITLAERFSPIDDNLFIPLIATISLFIYGLI